MHPAETQAASQPLAPAALAAWAPPSVSGGAGCGDTHSHCVLSRLEMCCARASPARAAITEVKDLVVRGLRSKCPK
jgi:hypothetical protein